MLRAIETFVKGALPKRVLDDGEFVALAGDPFPIERRFPTAMPDWFSAVNRWRKNTVLGALQRAGVRADLHFPGVGFGRQGRTLYLPLVKFNAAASGIAAPGRTSRHANDFWDALSERHAGKRLLVFMDSVTTHGFLEATLETTERDDWLMFLDEHPCVVDRAWLVESETAGTGGHIHMVGAHEPRLVRWVNL